MGSARRPLRDWCVQWTRRWEAACDLRRAGFIAAVCAVLFVLVNWRNFLVDTIAQALVPVCVVREGTLQLDTYRAYYEQLAREGRAWSFVEVNGHLYPMHSYFVPFLLTPFYLPPILAGVPTDAVRFWVAWGRLCAGLVTGVSMGLLYLALRRFGTVWSALAITLMVAFGTAVWTTAAQAGYDHMATVLGTSALALVLGPLPLRPGRAALAAFLIGATVGMRATTVVLLFPVGVYLFFRPGVLAGWGSRLAAAAGIAIVPALSAVMNAWLYGHWYQTGYSTQEVDRWSTPVWEGLPGLLVAPSAGLFIQSPFTLLAVIGGWAAWTTRDLKQRGLLLVYALCFVCYCLLYSRWWDWRGGLVPSTRMLCDGYPLWALLALVGWNHIRRRPGALVLVTVAAGWSLLFHLVGIAVFDDYTNLERPQGSPWLPQQSYLVEHIQAYGALRTLQRIALTTGEFVVSAVIAVYVLTPIFLPDPGPTASAGPRSPQARG